MKKTNLHFSRSAGSALSILAGLVLVATFAIAVPFHEPVVDGTITGNGTDWDLADLVVNDVADDNLLRSANVRRLWCTWDAEFLYLGVTYQDFGAQEALTVYVDLDRGVGPITAADLDTYAGNFRMPGGHGIELVLGRDKADGFPGTVPGARLVTDEMGTTSDISASILAAQAANTGTKSAAAFPFWLNAEFALPWSAIYPDEDGTVPAYAVVKAVAVATSAADTLNGIDAAPSNPGLDGGSAPVVFSRLHASVIDADGDGEPDPADASISGLAILPDDGGTAAITATAELTDFAGRGPGAPLSMTTTAAGVREWTLPRLPAGTYDVTLKAEGYFPEVFRVEVTEGEAVIADNRTLAKATAISGNIGFLSGPGGPGTVILRSAAGTELDRMDFDSSGGPYLFFVQTGGTYTVAATAETYIATERTVPVTTGVDATNVDFLLQRQTQISGTVSFASGPGAAGTVRFLDDAGEVLDLVDFAASGGPFVFFTETGGQFTLTANAPTYVTTDIDLTVVTGQDQTDVALVLPRAAELRGFVSFEGPDSAGTLKLFENISGALRDTMSFAAQNDPISFFLEPGEYRLELDAPGYLPFEQIVTVGTEADDLGGLELIAVRATTLLLVDESGVEIPEVRGTVSTPVDNLWFLAQVDLTAVDQEGRTDLFDLGGELSNFRLSSRKMDDLSSPTGHPAFYASAELADTSSVVSFEAGRARFWMTNDSVEVLRVYLKQPLKDPLAGRIAVAFLDPQPTVVILTADRDSLIADGVESVQIRASLFDAAQNESRIPDLPVTFLIDENSSGRGQFEVATTTTNGDGEATANLIARGSGLLNISCSVVVGNRTLAVQGYSLDSEEELLRITAIPGDPAGWDLVLPGTLSSFTSPLAVTAQLIDAYGNAVPQSGRAVSFSLDPPTLGSFDPVTAVSDTSGRAVTTFQPVSQAGLVTFFASSADFPGDEAGIQLGDLFVIQDPAWYDEPTDHQTFQDTDLTAVVIDNTPDELTLDIPFSSGWNGLQVHVLIETGFDAVGGTIDPFTQPVVYAHDLLPDFALTAKYSANDYGDFRAWRNNRWEWWSPEAEDFQPSNPSGQNIQNVWTEKGAESFNIRIPWAPFVVRPDSLMIEVYLTQDENDTKRSAFDSAPSDATLNLDFDPFDPGENDWDIATSTVTLSSWSAPYVVKTDFATPPKVTEVTADPVEILAGGLISLTALVTDGGDGIGDVLADLSGMGGGSLVRMFDDGDASHGDEIAGDGIFSLSTLVPPDNPGGKQTLIVNAYDASNTMSAAESAEITVEAILEPILYVEDAIGDDHGPNQPGVLGKYYTYPTNLAFVTGAFDITSLTVFETRQFVGGEPVEMIAFQVAMVDFPDPADPGTADWNPNFADLNIEKIDILIDSAPGGATASLPNRLAAFQSWDAWDYAIIMDGWFKALVPSLGQNTTDSWRSNAMTTDRDIILRSDPELNTMTALVSKEALGSPTAEDIRGWDIAVCMSSHDFGAEEVLGGIRWVNAKRSEWQFGGGNQDNDDNVDANLVDLLLVAGTGHNPGLSQEDILDYESTAAKLRNEAGLTNVAIEMSAFLDTGPPVIDTGGDGSVVTQVNPIVDAPLALALNIYDDFQVDKAIFRYRSTGYQGDGWDREVAMGALGSNLWVVDIMPSWLDSNLIYSPVDSTRYLEFEVWAVDGSDDKKETTSPVTTLQIWPDDTCRSRRTTLDKDNLSLLQMDGSQLTVPAHLRRKLTEAHVADAWTGAEVAADTMGRFIELVWDLCQSSGTVADAVSIPPAKPLGVFRDIYLSTADTLGGRLDFSGQWPGTLELSLHYPQVWVPKGKDENKLALYRYNAASDRWVLIGGHVSALGNTVSANVKEAGTFGLFLADGLDYTDGDVISGITISPNPFSPNNDGLYDETTISFYLDRTASVTVEIYNIEGIRKNILQDTFEYAGGDLDGGIPRRVPGLIWDGTDLGGTPVPYGIYIMRVTAVSGPDGNKRTVRSNHSLAVIK
jgi:C-terminal binding-module, SLH-like, of glucodextranase